MTSTPTHFRLLLPPLAGAWAWALLSLAGCVSPWERSALLNDKRAEIGSVQGPTERGLRGRLWERRRDAVDGEDALLKPIAGTDEYHAAEKLYEQKKYAEAENAFKKVAKEFKKSEIREDALFMQAEAAFAQERYAKGHDLYAQLLKDYPTTRHIDEVSSRLFKVAMIWLDHPQVADVDEIQQVNHDRYAEKLPPTEPAKLRKRNILVPNFTNKREPLFDPQGNAVAALRSIWTNDPTGPLADDALMLAASYYARSGEFVEADRHFTMLREQFPNSPHVQKAFELGSHTKLMSYEGSAYDDKSLKDAEQLKLATLRLYPDLDSKERMQTDLKKIEQANADRLWAMAVFYHGKGRKNASAIYCHLLLTDYPDSPYAKKAQKKLDDLGPGYADGRALKSSYPDPPKTLYTSIFPPDDHGGIPVPPTPVDPNAPPAKYGAKLALFKPERVNPPAAANANRPSPESKLAKSLPKKSPPKEVQPVEDENEDEESELSPASDSEEDDDVPHRLTRRRTVPKPLPDNVDTDAKPAPFGRSRLIPPDEVDEAEVEDEDEESGSGHTRL